jgi:hypothetical protein
MGSTWPRTRRWISSMSLRVMKPFLWKRILVFLVENQKQVLTY